MTQETFLNYGHWRWFWISVLITVAAIVLYVVDPTGAIKSGSTVYGYSVGIFSALAMAYLLWYGTRKRGYYAHVTTLRGVLSAHVWIGLTLLVLVPLHCGFRFHWNVHTWAFILCVLTIVTGIWGVYLYRALPERIKSNRGEGSMKNLLEQFDTFGQSLRKLELKRSDAFVSLVTRLDTYRVPSLPKLLFGRRARPLSKEVTASALQNISESERNDALAAISLIDKRYEFLVRIEREALVQFWLKCWLLLHVPLACGAVLLLIVHIVSVLYYG